MFFLRTKLHFKDSHDAESSAPYRMDAATIYTGSA
jgi:hypothetical protein